MGTRFLGIFVHPAHVQSEGLQPVFDNLEAAGATAVAFVPRVARPALDGTGVRFPDLHVDGYKRVLARPVWGRREINLEMFRAHEPDLSLYQGCSYQPTTKPVPAEVNNGLPRAMVEEAKRRGMEAHLQLHPFVLPRLKSQDQPVYVDGTRPTGPLVADVACPNNPDARAYARALVQDTIQHYGDIDGLFLDWAEFPAYRLEDHFACFCPHCEQRARDAGFDWDRIKLDVAALWRRLHRLTPAELETTRRIVRNPSALVELLMSHPGWVSFLRFKAQTVVGFYRQIRRLLDELGLHAVHLSARGWPPPWNRSSGMDYRLLADVCDAVTPKLFTFDYSALPRWYGETLLAWNPGLSESGVLDALVAWMQLDDDIVHRTFAHYQAPSPTAPHPARLEVYRPRLDEVATQVGNRARLYPFAHASLPESQWEQMLTLIGDSPADGMWVQMYGYLDDRKLAALGASRFSSGDS
ncbi:MAG: hypothetical protein ACRDJH_22290 [Thermomicrobiales bacterium]